MIEIIIILIVLALLYFGYVNMDNISAFDIKLDAVYFYQNKKLIVYADILSMERDLTNSIEGRVIYITYVITFYNENKETDSFRFYLAITDTVKWETLKANVLRANPFAKINESIL